MNIFGYSEEWADLVVAQLATTHGTRHVSKWGYACLVVGKEFEEVIERNWDKVDKFTGPYLHIFSFLPPPKLFVQERLNALKQSPSSPDREIAKEKYLKLIQSEDIDRSILIREKVCLLKDLREAGLKVDQYADFLFLQFRKEGADIIIDVIAIKNAGIPIGADDRDYLTCIDKMTSIAKKHYQRNSPANVVVKDMTLHWDVKVSIQKATGLCDYIKSFLKNLK